MGARVVSSVIISEGVSGILPGTRDPAAASACPGRRPHSGGVPRGPTESPRGFPPASDSGWTGSPVLGAGRSASGCGPVRNGGHSTGRWRWPPHGAGLCVFRLPGSLLRSAHVRRLFVLIKSAVTNLLQPSQVCVCTRSFSHTHGSKSEPACPRLSIVTKLKAFPRILTEASY